MSGADAVSTEPGNDAYAFGPFLLEPRERRLLRNGQPVPLTVKAFDLLEVLVRRDGRLLHKEELLQSVWPNAVVEENNLTVTMSALRKALGEGPSDREYIETVPRRGYRFVADVRPVAKDAAPGTTGTPAATRLPADATPALRGRARQRMLVMAAATLVVASVAAATLWLRRPPTTLA